MVSHRSKDMNNSRLVSGLMLGLSTFLLAAQPQPPAETGPTPEEKPDINEIIKTSTVFTNSVGTVMKKTGSGLWVSVYETTQKEYQEVTDSNPSAFSGPKRPVDSVSWLDASGYCKRLTQHEKAEEMLPEGYIYTLPTQAQWESLAKGIPLSHAVTGSGSRRSATANVGSLSASSAGLYDLRGNVAEWCDDSAGGLFPSANSFRVLRGGSWADWIEVNLRIDFRVMVAPDDAKNTYGFRCVLIKGS